MEANWKKRTQTDANQGLFWKLETKMDSKQEL